MLIINPKEEKTALVHSILLGAIAPRPIAFASTMDADGNPNLSPFSFFNVFSAKPPIVVFSPARRVRDNTSKHTLENIHELKEVVINVVNYDIVQQASLSSVEYAKGVSEFTKAGLTPIESVMVKPFRVKESPVQMECTVREVIELGENAGAGNLVICEVMLIHIDESILTEDNKIDPNKIDLVARMGGDYYCRASGDALFEVEKPNTKMGIGVDNIPQSIRNSDILTGNNLGLLGNVEVMPTKEEVRAYKILHGLPLEDKHELHTYAKTLLDAGKVMDAWKVLLAGEDL